MNPQEYSPSPLNPYQNINGPYVTTNYGGVPSVNAQFPPQSGNYQTFAPNQVSQPPGSALFTSPAPSPPTGTTTNFQGPPQNLPLGASPLTPTGRTMINFPPTVKGGVVSENISGVATNAASPMYVARNEQEAATIHTRFELRQNEQIGMPIVRESLRETEKLISIKIPETVKEVFLPMRTGPDPIIFQERVRHLEEFLRTTETEFQSWQARVTPMDERLAALRGENERLILEAQNQITVINNLHGNLANLQQQITVRPPQVVDRVVEVPQFVDRVVTREVDRPIYIDKPVQRFVDKPVYVEVERFVDRQVVVQKEVEVPVYFDKEVMVDRVVEVPIDKHIPVERVVDVEVPVYVDVPVHVSVPSPMSQTRRQQQQQFQQPVVVQKFVEVPVEKQIIVQQPIYIEVPVPIDKNIVVETIVEEQIIIEQPIITEVVVEAEIEQPVIIQQVVDVPVERPVIIGEVSEEVIVDTPIYIDQQVQVPHIVDVPVPMPVEQPIITNRVFEKPALYEQVLETKPVMQTRALVESKPVLTPVRQRISLGTQIAETNGLTIHRNVVTNTQQKF